ncbi:Ribbon-helix-helix protein, copG family [Monaibacterium marinum]|uniref:Ribbon-helix-helix protein, copG family n=1 Tax=Pontivivens marinum TaxID=1690039 RepID=A0A2C9CWQ4_9RHOB|nr:ribbon-helix-helix protein, CopG family [Monaibacterium marinum]SOH95697.1 Ribbon-helix-helix protein, copG family [Monaibacterium marinum]
MAPPKKNTEALTVRLERDLIGLIDEARRREGDIPTRPEMIRRILDAWSNNAVYGAE